MDQELLLIYLWRSKLIFIESENKIIFAISNQLPTVKFTLLFVTHKKHICI